PPSAQLGGNPDPPSAHCHSQPGRPAGSPRPKCSRSPKSAATLFSRRATRAPPPETLHSAKFVVEAKRPLRRPREITARVVPPTLIGISRKHVARPSGQ